MLSFLYLLWCLQMRQIKVQTIREFGKQILFINVIYIKMETFFVERAERPLLSCFSPLEIQIKIEKNILYFPLSL